MVIFLIIHFFDILALIGKNLTASDKAQPVETLFVLGGNSYERGVAAAEYLHNYPTPVVCTGGNYPVQIQALGFHLSEGELTKECLVRNGINSNEIQTWGKA
ncbi:MAG: hypothetical protein ACKO8Q_02190, partial [Bacteroidota bacterium]